MKTSEGFVRADSRNLPKVDLPMLLEFMHQNDVYNASEIRGAKVLMSSRDGYVDTAVGYVEIKRDNNICSLKARITPEHKVRTKMYTVGIVIDENTEAIKQVTCDDCAASAGGCKHGICFVHWLMKRTEEPSVTSVSCYWKKPTLSEVISAGTVLPAADLAKKRVFHKVQTSITLQIVLEECKKRKMIDSLLCNYSMHKERCLRDYSLYNMMLNCYQENSNMTYDTFKLYGEQIFNTDIRNEIERETRSQADSILWHSLRQGRVTASNIYDATRCTTANGVLVKSIMGGYKVPETKAIQRGKRLEKMVIQQLMTEMNVVIENCGLMLITPIIGASPDGLTEEFVIEIKCPFKERTIKNYITENNLVKDKFKSQIMLQMHATQRIKGLFCVADPNYEHNKKIIKIWVSFPQN
ncbi:uncharacterized protein LOC125490211 [Plutella xylostella]|uniref:uncharacterized protein LOC125490211 n=1 Tax=Plutella xylostella TaxID=51655 RepID=UPI00203319F0|nr:uncharacterized protein LOC125490211 [Plutella xylostella]